MARTRVTIEFCSAEKAASFVRNIQKGSGFIRWDNFDDDAWDDVDVISGPDESEEVGFRGPAYDEPI